MAAPGYAKTVSTPTPFPLIIFADGASSGNPGPGGWGAVIAWPDGQVAELGGGDPQTTNNRMELTAALRALTRISGYSGAVTLYTDSVYVIRGITQWIWGWRKNGWKTAEGQEVINQDLWKALSAELARQKEKIRVDWRHVRGHSGVPGNERVDEIAVAYSKGRTPSLYSGPLLGYSVPIHDLPENTELPEPKPRTAKKAPAYSYLSIIGTLPMRHPDWKSCESRVKGQTGARFKRADSAEEEAQILRSWGYGPDLKPR
jgi:ribonuclease HI